MHTVFSPWDWSEKASNLLVEMNRRDKPKRLKTPILAFPVQPTVGVPIDFVQLFCDLLDQAGTTLRFPGSDMVSQGDFR